MNLNDLNILTPIVAQAPGAYTSTQTSSAIDLSAYEGVVKLIQVVGTVSGTNPTWDLKVQDCATSGGSYADVSGLTLAQVTASTATGELQIDTRAVREFIKIVQTIGGTSTPTFNSTVIIIGKKRRLGTL